MKRWLGIPIYFKKHMCVACHKQIMDIYGHHAVVCPVNGDRIKRHNALSDCFCDFCSNAAWAPVKEKPFLVPFSSECSFPTSQQAKGWLLLCVHLSNAAEVCSIILPDFNFCMQ